MPTARLRVAPGFASVDARPYRFVLGPRPIGCQFVERTLTEGQLEVLRAAVGADGRRIFQIAGDPPAPAAPPAESAPPARRLVLLGGRQVDLAGRHRVVVRSCAFHRMR